MSLQASIDASFTTAQRDLFESGMVAEIGPNAFAVWMAIKSHADFNTGRAWPGMRKLAELTGLNKATIVRLTRTLIAARLLRVIAPGHEGARRGQTYIARERLMVRAGSHITHVLVIDYVPALMHEQITAIAQALKKGKPLPPAVIYDVYPGPGAAWDPAEGSIRGAIPFMSLAAAARPEVVDESMTRIGKLLKMPARPLPKK